MNSSGGTEQPLIVGGEVSESTACPRYRHVSATVHTLDYLAARYEPVLRFDTAESWRPLNVEHFFEEGQHHLCEEGGSCEATALTAIAGLNKKRSEKAYVDIAGSRVLEGGGEQTYHSPYPECTVNGLRDCNVGPRSAIYYRSPGVYSGYEYIDYWYFYRANYFWEKVDFHEGDWEGATVAPSLTGDSFDYAAFSQHGTFYSYARGVLRCEDSPSSTVPAAGTCGEGSARIDDFAANGDHANYTTPCSESTFMGWFILKECRSNEPPAFYERGYDGQKRWGRAYDEAETSLLPMPAKATSSWTDWPGTWGSPSIDPEEGSGPKSPGNQAFKVECAGLNNESGCETGPRIASARGVAGAIAGPTAMSPGLTAVSCANWAGAGISAVACNPKELRRAVLSGRVGARGDLTMTISDEAGRMGSGRGIVQVAGRSPVPNGAEVTIGGSITNETQVIVRAYDKQRKRIVAGRFKLARSSMARTARVGRVRLRLKIYETRAGRVAMSLGTLRAESIETVR